MCVCVASRAAAVEVKYCTSTLVNLFLHVRYVSACNYCIGNIERARRSGHSKHTVQPILCLPAWGPPR